MNAVILSAVELAPVPSSFSNNCFPREGGEGQVPLLKGFENEDDLVNYYKENPESYFAGVLFDIDSNLALTNPPNFTIRINSTYDSVNQSSLVQFGFLSLQYSIIAALSESISTSMQRKKGRLTDTTNKSTETKRADQKT